MNNTFNFSRFFTYFKYDLTQMWRNHSRAAILIGGLSAILYILWVLFSLVFTQTWTSPVSSVRFIVLLVAFAILELYTALTYGHLTDKKAGSNWLMIPASRAEKFVSMVLISVVVIPVMFGVVYFAIDGFLSLVDPTYGKALITSLSGAYSEYYNLFAKLSESEIENLPITFGGTLFATIVGAIGNFLYFLLCGTVFKKNKIVMSIVVLMGVSILMSTVLGLLAPKLAALNLIEDQLIELVPKILNWSLALAVVVDLALGWGVWRRIKTLQH